MCFRKAGRISGQRQIKTEREKRKKQKVFKTNLTTQEKKDKTPKSFKLMTI